MAKMGYIPGYVDGCAWYPPACLVGVSTGCGQCIVFNDLSLVY